MDPEVEDNSKARLAVGGACSGLAVEDNPEARFSVCYAEVIVLWWMSTLERDTTNFGLKAALTNPPIPSRPPRRRKIPS